jgi:hypothetical protein
MERKESDSVEPDFGDDPDGDCLCHDCETYFNPNIKLPVINVTEEDSKIAMKIWDDPKLVARRMTFGSGPCKLHITDPVIRKIEYVGWHDEDENETEGRKSMTIYYRYEGCQVKCELTLVPRKEGRSAHFYAWGICVKTN